MQEVVTLARPYAKALFKLAEASQQLPQTSAQLQLLNAVVADQDLAVLIGHPRVPHQQMAELIIDVMQSADEQSTDEHMQNFIRLLAENDRLPLLPEIAAQYEHLRAQAENRLDVQVLTAQALTDEQQQQLRDSLSKRFGREIKLATEIDESLMSGAIIRAGDQVIDGSARGRLQRLQQQLTH